MIQKIIGIVLALVIIGCTPTQEITKEIVDETPEITNGIFLIAENDNYFSFLSNESKIQVDGKPFYFQPSAIQRLDETYYIASDNLLPEQGQYLTFGFEDGELKNKSIIAFENKPVLPSISDMCRVPNSELMMATTHFKEYKEKDPATHKDNFMIIWRIGEESKYTIAHSGSMEVAKGQEVTTSYPIRQKLIEAINKHKQINVQKFEIGAIHFMPGNQLIIAVNITDAFGDIHSLLLETKYSINENGMLNFRNTYTVFKEFDISSYSELEQKQYIVDLDYDSMNDRFIILTAFKKNETAEGVGGYIWFYDDTNNLFNDSPPLLGLLEDKTPMLFRHKPSGITLTEDGILLIIFDDDEIEGESFIVNQKTQFSRQPYEAAYIKVAYANE